MKFNMHPGDTILWYNEADTKVAPLPATIIRCNENGVANICLFGSGPHHGSVYHVSDQRLFQGGRKTQSAIKFGAWDFHPRFPNDVEELSKGEKRVIELSSEFSFDEVCAKVKSLGLSKSDVQEIYDRNGL